MQRAGDHVLAGAGLAEQQHGRVGRGDLLDLGQHAAERGARAHQLVEAPRVVHLLLEHDVLRLEPLLQLAHLRQARLERCLRLLQLRHVRVHHHRPGLLALQRRGRHGVDALPGRSRVPAHAGEARALARRDGAEGRQARGQGAAVRRGPLEDAREIVTHRRAWKRAAVRAARPGLVQREDVPLGIHRDQLVRERREDGAVQLQGGLQPRLGGPPVERARKDGSPGARAGGRPRGSRFSGRGRSRWPALPGARPPASIGRAT